MEALALNLMMYNKRVVYVGKRVVALTFLGIASVLLFTSAFTDFGINVGGMLLNLLAAIQDKLSGISFGG